MSLYNNGLFNICAMSKIVSNLRVTKKQLHKSETDAKIENDRNKARFFI